MPVVSVRLIFLSRVKRTVGASLPRLIFRVPGNTRNGRAPAIAGSRDLARSETWNRLGEGSGKRKEEKKAEGPRADRVASATLITGDGTLSDATFCW